MSQLLASRTSPWLASFKGLIFPSACLICNQSMSLSAVDVVCRGCNDGLRPSRYTAPGDTSPEDLDDLFALYQYGSAARRLIHRIKLNPDPRAGRWLEPEIARLPLERMSRFDLIVPVPSHRRAGLLALGHESSGVWVDALSSRLRIPSAKALTRIRTVAKQTSLRRDLRLTASESSLSVRSRDLKNCRSVLLADDVLTTGATARGCARLLKRHGVEHVAIAVIARG